MTQFMKTKKQNRLEHRMNLQELLVAMALGMMLVGYGFEIAFRSWKQCLGYTRSATRCAEVKLIRQNWRRFVHRLPAKAALASPAVLVAGDCRVRVGEDGLVFETPEHRRLMPLDENMRAVMTIEDGGHGNRLLVLTVTAKNRIGKLERMRRSRIVACAPRPQPGEQP